MIIYKYTLEEVMEDIDTFCYNWNLIKLCHELWKNEIIDAYGEKMELYKIAGVGMNYINEICACKVNRETCKRTFNATKKSGVLEYVRGLHKITEITKLKEYIVLTIVYNDWLNKKRRVKHLCDNKDERLEQAEEKLKQINDWLEKNYNHKKELKEYLKSLKETIMEQIQSLPKLVDEKHYTPIGKIKNYLLGEYATSKISSEQYEYLTKAGILLIELDCDTIASFTDENLEVLEKCVGMLFRRVNAERDYRKVRKEEKMVIKQSTEGADEKYIDSKENTIYDEE